MVNLGPLTGDSDTCTAVSAVIGGQTVAGPHSPAHDSLKGLACQFCHRAMRQRHNGGTWQIISYPDSRTGIGTWHEALVMETKPLPDTTRNERRLNIPYDCQANFASGETSRAHEPVKPAGEWIGAPRRCKWCGKQMRLKGGHWEIIYLKRWHNARTIDNTSSPRPMGVLETTQPGAPEPVPAKPLEFSKRCGDADRENVLAQLRHAFTTGHLDQDELEARAGLALSARVKSDLPPLLHDLPAEALMQDEPILAPALPSGQESTWFLKYGGKASAFLIAFWIVLVFITSALPVPSWYSVAGAAGASISVYIRLAWLRKMRPPLDLKEFEKRLDAVLGKNGTITRGRGAK